MFGLWPIIVNVTEIVILERLFTKFQWMEKERPNQNWVVAFPSLTFTGLFFSKDFTIGIKEASLVSSLTRRLNNNLKNKKFQFVLNYLNLQPVWTESANPSATPQ